MFEWLKVMFLRLVTSILSLLPASPFREYITSWSINVPNAIAWLNWFIDIRGMLAVFLAWLGVYIAYLVISIILRWIKAID